MKGPAGYGRIMGILMNAILSVCMLLIVMTSVGAPITPESFFQGWFASFCIGYAFGEIIPVGQAGPALSRALKLKNPVVSYLINAIICGAYYGTVILFGMGIINVLSVGGWPAVFGFFIGNWPLVLAASIGIVILIMWLLQRIATAISGFDPMKAHGAPRPRA